jgi:hypothetical protein
MTLLSSSPCTAIYIALSKEFREFRGDSMLNFCYLPQVNLLFLVTAPEISVGKQPLIVVPFHPLGDDKILPQAAHITPQIRRIEIVDDNPRYPHSLSLFFSSNLYQGTMDFCKIGCKLRPNRKEQEKRVQR